MVVQEYALFPHMTVRQNVSFGLNNLSNADKKDRVAEVMSLVRLENLEDRYPFELSGGQQQRIALARTMAPRPFAVLLDEPFSNIDAGMRSDVRRDVEGILRANNTAAVLVTHDRDEAFAIADRVAIMSEGELNQVDAPEVVYHLPANRRVAQMTGTCDFINGVVLDGGLVETEAGILPYDTHSSGIIQGSGVEVVIHPDDFGIDASESGAMVVQAREFRGDETVLVVALPSGATIRCRQESYCAITPGQRLDLILQRPGPFAAFSV
jgi:iron(III) transport system ATP-binding protein